MAKAKLVVQLYVPDVVMNSSPGAKKRYVAGYIKNKDLGREGATEKAIEFVKKEYYFDNKTKIYRPIKTLTPLKERYNKTCDLPLDVANLPEDYKVMWMVQYNSSVQKGTNKNFSKDNAWKAVKNFIYFDDKKCKWIEKKKKNCVANAFQKALKQKLIKGEIKGVGKMSFTVDCDEEFKFFVPLTKDEKGELVIKESKDKKFFIDGEASNTKIDKENDQVTEEFLGKMQKSALGLTVFKEHKRDIDNAIGVIDKVVGSKDTFSARTHLLKPTTNEMVADIVNKMAHGINMGYSIGGRLTKVEFIQDEDSGTEVRKLVDGHLDEISITVKPAGEVEFASVMAKSLDKVQNPGSVSFTKEDMNSMIDDIISGETVVDEKTRMIAKLFKSLDSIEEMQIYEDFMDKIRQSYWKFTDLISKFVNDDNLSKEEKKFKIQLVTDEFTAIMVTEVSNIVGSALLNDDV